MSAAGPISCACYNDLSVTNLSLATVSITLVRALAVAVERSGIVRERFLNAAGIDARRLEDMHARIPLDDYRRVVRAAYELSADPALGLHLGEQMSLATFDVLGHLTEHGTSLRDVFEMILRYSRIVSEGPRLQFEEHGDCATIRFDLPERDTPESRLASEFSSVAMLRLVRRFVGHAALPRRVSFTHRKPPHAAEYGRFFGGAERFSEEFTEIEIERAWLDQAPHCHENEMRGYLVARAELLLARASEQMSAAERVARWLDAQAELSQPTLAKAARDLGLSPRSLRRRLKHEQAQFSTLLDNARAAQAKQRLQDPQERQIQDTAYALGFRTASAFSRAFKRWTGETPKAYRKARVERIASDDAQRNT